TERTLDTALLAEEFEKEVSCPVERFADVEAAWKRLMSVKDEEDLAFCIGSLYLIGEIKQILRRNQHD
ncbi:MAG: bifunctional folylpolyglutamate synthase/dihydrofolate synthase, partial [Hungatella sp.]